MVHLILRLALRVGYETGRVLTLARHHRDQNVAPAAVPQFRERFGGTECDLRAVVERLLQPGDCGVSVHLTKGQRGRLPDQRIGVLQEVLGAFDGFGIRFADGRQRRHPGLAMIGAGLLSERLSVNQACH